MDFIKQRLLEGRDVLAGAQFKDLVLGLLALQETLEAQPGKRVGTNLL